MARENASMKLSVALDREVSFLIKKKKALMMSSGLSQLGLSRTKFITESLGYKLEVFEKHREVYVFGPRPTLFHFEHSYQGLLEVQYLFSRSSLL